MNIRLIKSVIRRPAARVLALALSAAITALGGSALAQSGTVSDLTKQTGPAPASAVFGPGTRVVPASSVRTAADVSTQRLAPGAISHAVVNSDVGRNVNLGNISLVNHGCQSCNQPACNGGCQSSQGGCNGSCGGSCGGNCGGSCNGGCGGNCQQCSRLGYGSKYLNAGCGIPCDPYWYVSLEAIYLDRRGGTGISLTRGVPGSGFDPEHTPRLTIGSVPNCINGWEFTWVGSLEFERGTLVTDPNGGLDSIFTSGPGLDPTFLDPFYDANVQASIYRSEYWSAEINRTLVGWDVSKFIWGGRYIRLDEDYLFASRKDSFNSTADILSRTRNNLIGGQVGLDLLYPLTRCLYSDIRTRGGLYINYAESDVTLRNTGSLVGRAADNDWDWAGVFEFGGGLRWQVSDAVSFRCAGEAWYITNIASAPDQVSRSISNSLRNGTNINEDMFYIGVSLGGEVRF